MVTTITGPPGTGTTTVCICQIIRIETHILTFFEEKVYNLYLFVEEAAEEHFYMFVYKQRQDMEQAQHQLSALLKDTKSGDHAVQIVPPLAASSEQCATTSALKVLL